MSEWIFQIDRNLSNEEIVHVKNHSNGELVRCKNCRFAERHITKDSHGNELFICSKLVEEYEKEHPLCEMFFCANGQRKE